MTRQKHDIRFEGGLIIHDIWLMKRDGEIIEVRFEHKPEDIIVDISSLPIHHEIVIP